MRAAYLVLVAAAAAASPLTPLLDKIKPAVEPGRAMNHMRQVWWSDRWFTFPKFHETAKYLKGAMEAAGLEQVEIVHPPADGKTQFGYWTMPLAWDVSSARLEIAEPAAPRDQRVLADYRRVPASVCMWSGPADNLTAEVVEPAKLEEADVRGKFVLFSRNPAGAKWLLAKKGAAGAVNAFSENPELKDERQWINSWGDRGWAFNQGDTPLPCFSITPRQAELLRGLMRQGPVRLRATSDARYSRDSYPYVTGVIPGAGTDEEVLTLGHTSEQGAHDNATGVAAMLEALTTLNGLIKSGALPRPKRTIRMLAMGELYASMHYVAANPERIRRTIAAMCVDTPAAPYELKGTEYTWHLNPHVSRSFVDALTIELASEYFPSVKRPWHEKPFMPGTDTFLADPLIGVPTVWPYSDTGVHSHHMTADTPATVDARSLRDLAVVNATFLYFLASAGEAEARWLAEVTLRRGEEQVRAASPERLAYVAGREKQALGSIRRLAAVDVSRQERRLERLAGSAEASGPRQRNSDAGRLIVRRKRFGTLPLDDLAVDQREGYPSGAWSTPLMTALWWCDGRRTLDEVIHLTELELGPQKFDFAGYFRFLARKGYVELREGPAR